MKKIKSIYLSINYLLIISLLTYSLKEYISAVNIYGIKEVIITGNNYIEDESIRESISSLIINKNIFNINIRDIRKIINENNYIFSNEVSTKSPSTLSIRITEVKPTGLIKINDEIYFLNQKMERIKADINAINHFNNYPIITNLTKNDIEMGRVKNILKEIINKSNTIYEKLNEIQIHNTEIILILNNNTKIIMSSTDYENNLKKLFEFNNQVIIRNNLILEKYNYINMKIPYQIIINEKKI